MVLVYLIGVPIGPNCLAKICGTITAGNWPPCNQRNHHVICVICYNTNSVLTHLGPKNVSPALPSARTLQPSPQPIGSLEHSCEKLNLIACSCASVELREQTLLLPEQTHLMQVSLFAPPVLKNPSSHSPHCRPPKLPKHEHCPVIGSHILFALPETSQSHD